MIRRSPLQNKLFFVCPFSQLEQSIRKEYGNVYFFTAPAAIFNFDDERVVAEISSFLNRENVSDLYFVCDEGCRFINNVLYGNVDSSLACETTIESFTSLSDQPSSLAEKIIWKQLDAIKNCNSLASLLNERGIKLHGLITSKKPSWHITKYYYFKIPTLSYS